MVNSSSIRTYTVCMVLATVLEIAIEMVTETQKRFPNLTCMSFDKGFHSKNNQKELKEHLERVVLPKKG